jgi:hypothetical protein
VDATLIHEYGHMVQNWLVAEAGANPERAIRDIVGTDGTGLLKDTLNDWWRSHPRATKVLSGYAATSPFEAWADSRVTC